MEQTIGGAKYKENIGIASDAKWCWAFDSYYLEKAGVINNKEARALGGESVHALKKWKDYSFTPNSGTTPQYGDIIFFTWTDKSNLDTDHVEFVTKVENGYVYTFGGNRGGGSGQSGRGKYKLNDPRITAYLRLP